MAVNWAITITDEVSPKIQAAIDGMAASLAEKLDEAGTDMENYAKRIVPVKTGLLRSSIGHSVNPGTLQLDFFATAQYAQYVEFGTRRMTARPFMRAAWDYYRQTLLQKMGDAVLVSLGLSVA